LVKATGLELEVRVRAPCAPIDRLIGPIGRRVRRHRRQLVEAAASHGITQLRVFGSVARGEDRLESDVDILAEVPDDLGLLGLGRAAEELEAILNARVDLVPAASLKADVARRVGKDLVPL
jgi:predicted nucleotidyltransferase